MEVENISLSITNISLNENKERQQTQDAEIKKDLQKPNLIDKESGMECETKSNIETTTIK